MLTFQIPGLRLVSLGNVREHWSKRAKRVENEKRLTRVCGQAAGVHRLELPLVVTIVRCGPGTLDDDNAVGSAKGVRDAIAALVGVDDGDKRWTWRIEQRRAKTWGVEVRIERQEESMDVSEAA